MSYRLLPYIFFITLALSCSHAVGQFDLPALPDEPSFAVDSDDADPGIFADQPSAAPVFDESPNLESNAESLPQLEPLPPISSDATPPRSSLKSSDKWREDRQEIISLQRQIRQHDKEDKEGRDELVTKLRDLMTGLFDADYAEREAAVVKLEERVGKLRADLEKRKAARDRIIGVRIDRLLLDADGLNFPVLGDEASVFSQPNFEVVKLIPQPNGDQIAEVLLKYTKEPRQRTTTYTVMVPQQRTRMTPKGTEVKYQVMVPEQRQRTETYYALVPINRKLAIKVPNGQDVHTFLEKAIKSEATPDSSRFSTPARRSDWKSVSY